jgi:hypothetical protein
MHAYQYTYMYFQHVPSLSTLKVITITIKSSVVLPVRVDGNKPLCRTVMQFNAALSLKIALKV